MSVSPLLRSPAPVRSLQGSFRPDGTITGARDRPAHRIWRYAVGPLGWRGVGTIRRPRVGTQQSTIPTAQPTRQVRARHPHRRQPSEPLDRFAYFVSHCMFEGSSAPPQAGGFTWSTKNQFLHCRSLVRRGTFRSSLGCSRRPRPADPTRRYRDVLRRTYEAARVKPE